SQSGNKNRETIAIGHDVAQVCPQHHHLAVSHVDDAHNAKRHAQGQGGENQDGAKAKPVEKSFKESGHGWGKEKQGILTRREDPLLATWSSTRRLEIDFSTQVRGRFLLSLAT